MPELSRRLLLLRHGQSTWNADGRWQGQADPPLSVLGEQQAHDAAGRLAGTGFVRLVTSDLRRAVQTGEIIGAALGLAVDVDPALREIDVGDWTGLTRPEIEAGWPGELARWSDGVSDAPPGGESRFTLVARTREAMGRVAASIGPGDHALVVGHGALLRHLDRALGLQPTGVGNLAGRWYEVDENGGIVAGDLVSLADPEERTLSPSV